MGYAFDIIKTHRTKPVDKPKSVKSAKLPQQNTFLFFGLVVIIFLIVADISNGSSSKTQISANKSQDTASVLGESTNDSPANNTSPTSSNPATPDTSNTATSSPSLSSQNNQTPTDTTTNNQIDKSQIQIKILNGSGKSGMATSTKSKLESLGFTIDSVGTAKNTYQKTVIYYNTDKKDLAVILQLALENQNISLQENPTLTNGFDLLLVVGQK